MCAPCPSAISTLSGGSGGWPSTLSYPELWYGTSFDPLILYPMEFDADQLLGPPYHCAPFALIGDQKCKLRRDRADYLKRRSSLGLVANETGDCVPTELDASGLHEATPGCAVRRPNWGICATCSHASVVKQSTARKGLDLGLRNYTRADLEAALLGNRSCRMMNVRKNLDTTLRDPAARAGRLPDKLPHSRWPVFRLLSRVGRATSRARNYAAGAASCEPTALNKSWCARSTI